MSVLKPAAAHSSPAVKFSGNPTGQTEYFPQLDSLRAVAIFLVMAQHFPFPSAIRKLGPGWYGVQIFFVLSGFLITTILLNVRQGTEQVTRESKWHSLRQFYVRRFLRIFPLFYAVLIAAAIIGFPFVRESFWWHFFYCSNIYMALLGTHPGPVTHFWSLSVEEHFYLFWPLAILFTPKRMLRHVIFLLVAIGPASRMVCGLMNLGPFFGLISTCYFDSLGLGALLAYVRFSSLSDIKGHVERFCRISLVLGAALFMGCMIVSHTLSGTLFATLFGALQPAGTALCWVYLVGSAANGFSGVAGGIMENPILIYVGKISYGLYVYHLFIPDAVTYIVRRFEIPMPVYGWLPVYIFVTFAISALSWQFFEKPINDLRKKYRYLRTMPKPRSETNYLVLPATN